MNARKIQFLFVALFCAMTVSAQSVIGNWHVNDIEESNGVWTMSFGEDNAFGVQSLLTQSMKLDNVGTIIVEIAIAESGHYETENGKISMSLDPSTLGSNISLSSPDLTQEQKDAVAAEMKDKIHEMNQSIYDYCKEVFKELNYKNLPYTVNGNKMTIKDPESNVILTRIE